jgi:hypothetical protein
MRDSRNRRRAPLWALALAVAPALVSCQHLGPTGCSGERADLASPPRRLHLRVELARGEQTSRHELRVQVEPGRITAVGLTPLGTRAYALTHEPDGIRVDNRIGRHLGYDPRRVYDAIAHAYLARAPGPGDPPGPLVTRGDDEVRVANERCGYRARLVAISDERA